MLPPLHLAPYMTLSMALSMALSDSCSERYFGRVRNFNDLK